MIKAIIDCVVIDSLVVVGIGSYYAVKSNAKLIKKNKKEKEESQDKDNAENLSFFFKLKAEFNMIITIWNNKGWGH